MKEKQYTRGYRIKRASRSEVMMRLRKMYGKASNEDQEYIKAALHYLRLEQYANKMEDMGVITCDRCMYYDGDRCRNMMFFLREDEEERMVFKTAYREDDDFCSYAEEGTFDQIKDEWGEIA